MLSKSILLAFFTILAVTGGISEAKAVNITLCCTPQNDLYKALIKHQGISRYDEAAKAVGEADPGSAVLILADGYPEERTKIDPKLLEEAQKNGLRLYVEYPDALPGIEFGEAKEIVWERAVVSTDAFGKTLPKLQILTVNGCRYLLAKADDPLLVIARVAGFDTAVYGIPQTASPLLFETTDKNLLVATTKLSGFVTGRYAPTAAWKTFWEQVLKKLGVDEIKLEWVPAVSPAYGKSEKLPDDAEVRALKSAASFYHNSRLLVPPSRIPSIKSLLASGAETCPVPSPDEPAGDGSLGILEGYASGILCDGNQLQRLPMRADCNAEVAMVLALDWLVNGNARSRDVAKNLLDYIFFTSDLQRGPRGNPKHPAFGLIAWGTISPTWERATYGDDEARVMLSTMAAAACLQSDTWDESLMKGLLANLRTTGPQGFRGDRIDMPELEANGWRYYQDTPRTNCSPHFESYLWACNLWAYHHTKYAPFLEKTKAGIRTMMEAYPDGWRWKDSIERARMILCLSWLVRLEDTPEHRGWLKKVADDLLSLQQPCGALQEKLGGVGGGHYWIPPSNEAYGTAETPLIQQNGDPASDQLYTTGFALLGLHEAAAATGDESYKKAEDKLAEFLCRIQIKSQRFPYINGAWFRAFDYGKWDYWASSADLGWGAWSIETGWGTAWTAAVLGLRARNTSLWDITSDSQIERRFRSVREQMKENDGGPWTGKRWGEGSNET